MNKTKIVSLVVLVLLALALVVGKGESVIDAGKLTLEPDGCMKLAEKVCR